MFMTCLGYWTALNREVSGQKHHYFINVCQALNDRPKSCPKTAISACQVDYNTNRQVGMLFPSIHLLIS